MLKFDHSDTYRHPASDKALMWKDLEPGLRIKLLEINEEDNSTHVAMCAMVMGGTFTYFKPEIGDALFAETWEVVNLLLADGTVRTISERECGFSPLSDDGPEFTHGPVYFVADTA